MYASSRIAGVLLAAGTVLAAGPAASQEPPSPEDVLGHAPGERFTDAAGVVRYMDVLAEASPLVSVERYGETPEGRPLLQVTVASPPHRAGLASILEANRELTLPSTPEPRAREIAASNPAVVYFSYGVHGNESSSSEAAMWTAWDLARGAAEVEGVLDSVVVVIDPMANPDGRDRYVQWYRQMRGVEPNPDPAAREHREPWPGGRYNHWLFDLNRDWAWATQPETRARLATWDRWNPQVHVDFHEMSYTSTYFFFPAVAPINPLYPDHILEWGRRFGEANASAFDRHGWLYYTAEGFDLFYPGYGDSWPSLTGAVGMTYEQAGHSRAGLVIERPDGSLLTLSDRALHHRTSGNATLREAAEGRTGLLLGFAGFHRNVDEGLSDVLLVPEGEGGPADDLVALLRSQGIEVERAGESFRARAQPHSGYAERSDFPAATYLVRARQPRGRLALTLLRPELLLDAEYSYDITAWSLPYAFGVEAHTTDRSPDARWAPVVGVGAPRGVEEGSAAYGYLLPPGLEGRGELVAFLREGGRALVIGRAFTLEGREFPAGTVLLPRTLNPDLDRAVREAGLGARLHPARTGFTDDGPDLGTERAVPLDLPRVALLGGRGTSATSFGAHWFFLETRLGVPLSVIEVEDVGALDLSEYDVVVAPSGGGIRSALGEEGVERLRDWITAGGTLVAVDAAARALGELGEVEVREEPTEELEREEELERALRTVEEREAERWREQVPGTILEVRLDPRHPLTFGAGAGSSADRMFVLSGGQAFEPAASFQSPAWFPADPERTSGVISEANLRRLAQSSWLVETRVGRGKAILFADDPLFRLFWRSAFTPYVNALLLGPAF